MISLTEMFSVAAVQVQWLMLSRSENLYSPQMVDNLILTKEHANVCLTRRDGKVFFCPHS